MTRAVRPVAESARGAARRAPLRRALRAATWTAALAALSAGGVPESAAETDDPPAASRAEPTIEPDVAEPEVGGSVAGETSADASGGSETLDADTGDAAAEDAASDATPIDPWVARENRIRELVKLIREDQATLVALISEPRAVAQVDPSDPEAEPRDERVPALPLREDVRELAHRLASRQRELGELGGGMALVESPAIWR